MVALLALELEPKRFSSAARMETSAGRSGCCSMRMRASRAYRRETTPHPRRGERRGVKHDSLEIFDERAPCFPRGCED